MNGLGHVLCVCLCVCVFWVGYEGPRRLEMDGGPRAAFGTLGTFLGGALVQLVYLRRKPHLSPCGKLDDIDRRKEKFKPREWGCTLFLCHRPILEG